MEKYIKEMYRKKFKGCIHYRKSQEMDWRSKFPGFPTRYDVFILIYKQWWKLNLKIKIPSHHSYDSKMRIHTYTETTESQDLTIALNEIVY